MRDWPQPLLWRLRPFLFLRCENLSERRLKGGVGVFSWEASGRQDGGFLRQNQHFSKPEKEDVGYGGFPHRKDRRLHGHVQLPPAGPESWRRTAISSGCAFAMRTDGLAPSSTPFWSCRRRHRDLRLYGKIQYRRSQCWMPHEMLACTAVCYAVGLILWDDLHFETDLYNIT